MTHGKRVTLLLALAVLVVSAHVATAQQKRKAGPAKEQVWQVDFLMEGDHYIGTAALTTSKGVVTGKMVIESPTKVVGDVQGKQARGTLSLDYPYTMVAENCTGRVQVEAKFSADGQQATGTVHAVDCHNQPVDGTVTFTKGDAKGKPGSNEMW
jgi:hypothetical protein